MPTRTFTCFCQDESGKGTIWIDTIDVQADDAGNYPLALIQEKAMKACSEDWDLDWETDHSVICMGVALGDINFLYFDDSHLEE